MSIGLRIRGCRFDSCQGDFGWLTLAEPVAVYPHTRLMPATGLKALGGNMDWGSFAWGVVATFAFGGAVALLIGAAGSSGWFE
jgi:hypothetical protein